MPIYAINNNGVIVNVIEASSQEIAESITGMTALTTSGIPWIGYTYNGSSWIEPVEQDEYINETYTSMLFDGQEYFVDSTNSQVTLYLTNNPKIGDRVKVFDGKGQSSINNIIIDPNGFKIDSQESEYYINVDGSYIELTYTGSTIGWSTLGSDIKQYINNLNVLEWTGA